jgi:NADPH:quinone reductase-like Zn-dependent oxidoreductase
MTQQRAHSFRDQHDLGGEEVFGHVPAESSRSVQARRARATTAARLTAAALIRAADLRPGQTAVLIGAGSEAGTLLVPLLTEAGVRVIAGTTPEDDAYVRSLGAAETFEYAGADPATDALASHPDLDLLVDLVSFDEPYLITAAARHGTIVTARRGAGAPGIGIPRVGMSAEPDDLAALAA